MYVQHSAGLNTSITSVNTINPGSDSALVQYGYGSFTTAGECVLIVGQGAASYIDLSAEL
jgi:hypothetical protein